MSFQARLTTQQQFGYVPHTSVSGEAWELIWRGTVTDADNSDPYTTVTDSVKSFTANVYVGNYWIRLRSGPNKGMMKRALVSGTSSWTVETAGFAAAVGAGDEYELWKSPEPTVLIDSSSGETNAVDALRTEADDYWNGYYLCPLTGTHRGKIAQITDFANATGTFTVAAAFGTALAQHDVCVIRRFVDVMNVSPGVSEEFIPTPGNRVNFSRGDGVVGPRAGTLGFSTHIRPSGTDGSIRPPDIEGLLFASGYELDFLATNGTVDTGSTTTAIAISTATWENFEAGQAILVNGEITFITSMADGAGAADTLNVRPPLSNAPLNSDVIYRVRTYKKTTTGDVYGVWVEYEMDGVRVSMSGCKGNANLVDGSALEMSFDLNVDHYIREEEAAPYTATAAYSTVAPVLSQDRTAYLDDGSTATKTDVGAVAATLGTTVAPREVQGAKGLNGRCGFQITDYAARLSWNELLDNTLQLPQELRYTARTERDAMVIWGDGYNFAAVRAPAAKQIELPNPADSGGLQSVPVVFEAQDAGTQNDPDSVVQKVPDFVLVIS